MNLPYQRSDVMTSDRNVTRGRPDPLEFDRFLADLARADLTGRMGHHAAVLDWMAEQSRYLGVGRLTIDPSLRVVRWDQRDVEMTKMECRVLTLLVRAVPDWVSYRDIYDAMHRPGFHGGSGVDGFETNVRSTMKRIRSKFAEVRAPDDLFGNLAGFGYRINEEKA